MNNLDILCKNVFKVFLHYVCLQCYIENFKAIIILTFCTWTMFFLLSEVCTIFVPRSVKLHSAVCLDVFSFIVLVCCCPFYIFIWFFFPLIHFLYFLWLGKPKYKAYSECWLGEWSLDLQPKSVIINCQPSLHQRTHLSCYSLTVRGARTERACVYSPLCWKETICAMACG